MYRIDIRIELSTACQDRLIASKYSVYKVISEGACFQFAFGPASFISFAHMILHLLQ
jgi:hypothetical protein